VSLLPAASLDETDAARARRLKPTKKIKAADSEAGDDTLTAALDGIWSHSAMWSRAIRDFLKETRGTSLTLEHCRDLLASALARRPMSWVMIIRSRPSRLLVSTFVANLENEDSRIFIIPEIADHASIWRDVATARKALATYGSDTCRRRWYAAKPATKQEIAALNPHAPKADWLPSGFVA
jgi:hypothetical protein